MRFACNFIILCMLRQLRHVAVRFKLAENSDNYHHQSDQTVQRHHQTRTRHFI